MPADKLFQYMNSQEFLDRANAAIREGIENERLLKSMNLTGEALREAARRVNVDIDPPVEW